MLDHTTDIQTEMFLVDASTAAPVIFLNVLAWIELTYETHPPDGFYRRQSPGLLNKYTILVVKMQ